MVTDFLGTDGDAYFERNKHVQIVDHTSFNDPVMALLPEHVFKKAGDVKAMLDFGGANGWRGEFLRQQFGCDVAVLERSFLARSAGQQQYPELLFTNTLSAFLTAILSLFFK